ncbi:hypothetical protein SAY86_018279 [Trapa natans]|uniref:Uncharacterized protein n=1 Tax=Trapa natans TaxID=22666 RepID=A0AAN7LD20_TRANT|nr:hypothetical protein SAY86_018279 [Trapa natans]
MAGFFRVQEIRTTPRRTMCPNSKRLLIYGTVEKEASMGWAVADAVDYKGFPADRDKTGGWVPAALILGIEICERLSTMGIAVNLVTYLGGTMHLSSSTSANIVSDFMGTSFMLCLLGGFLADSFLGRYKTIAIFAFIQTLASLRVI